MPFNNRLSPQEIKFDGMACEGITQHTNKLIASMAFKIYFLLIWISLDLGAPGTNLSSGPINCVIRCRETGSRKGE